MGEERPSALYLGLPIIGRPGIYVRVGRLSVGRLSVATPRYREAASPYTPASLYNGEAQVYIYISIVDVNREA